MFAVLFLLWGCSNLEPKLTTDIEDFDGDGFSELDDCDDGNAAIYPTASELCNGLDDNCNNEIDENALDLNVFYADFDGDGFGDPQGLAESCDPIVGYVDNADDCDDTNAEIYVGADEVCNEEDDNCDGLIDEDVEEPWYLDFDGDGFGDPMEAVYACERPEGYVRGSTDCDDSDPLIYPDAPERCNDLDDDCDALLDHEETEEDLPKRFLDADGDGYGDIAVWVTDCSVEGYVSNWFDCDDSDSLINPDAIEVCDEKDNDCDGLMDDGDDSIDLTQGSQIFYLDVDGDGAGDSTEMIEACALLSGYSDNALDCDDDDASRFPGADEVCDDGLDNDCDSLDDCDDTDCNVDSACFESSCADGLDSDDDSYFDCLDSDCTSSVECGEICDDGIDNDLDGQVDCSDTECSNYHSSCIANACANHTVSGELGDISFGDSTGLSNDADPACGYYYGTGSDVSVSWEAHVSGCARFDLSASYDAILAVYADCSMLSSSSGYLSGACDSFDAASISCNVVAGEDYILLLDGYDDGEYGEYSLNVSVQESTSCSCQSECCTN